MLARARGFGTIIFPFHPKSFYRFYSMISQGRDVQILIAGLSPPSTDPWIHPSLPAGPPRAPRTHLRRWCSRCPGAVPCPGRWLLSSSRWCPGEGQRTGLTALLGLPEWPAPLTAGQVLREKLSQDMAGHGKSQCLPLEQLRLWWELQNSANPAQDGAGSAEGMTRREQIPFTVTFSSVTAPV